MERKRLRNLMIMVLSVSLVTGAVLAGGCTGKEEETKGQKVTFEQLLSNPEQYNGEYIVLEGFYFSGFEVTVLSENLQYSGYAEGHLIPQGRMVWIEGGIPKVVYERLYQQQMMGPAERYGKMMVEGKFEFGGEYGHLGGYSYHLISSDVELLPWSPEVPEEGAEFRPESECPTSEYVPEDVQIILDITPQQAFVLIQNTQNNPDFIIIDVRTPEEFAEEHIKGALNIDSHSETFQNELDTLDKNKTYLIYGVGNRSGSSLALMEELNFRRVFHMSGGINQWKAEGLPTIQETPAQIILDITPQQAFDLIQENQDNPDFIIIDVQAPKYFAGGHIENALNIDYFSETFQDELDTLDKNKTYLVYYTCRCGEVDTKTLRLMKKLNFREAYNILGGLVRWKSAGFPTVK